MRNLPKTVLLSYQNLGNFSHMGKITWQKVGNRIVCNMKNHKKQYLRVADNEIRAQARLSHKNKGFALVCSLLRYVWKELEGRSAELGILPIIHRGKGLQKPAFVVGPGPSVYLAMAVALRLSLPLSAALMTSSSVVADGWSNLGSFDPDEPTQMRKTSTPKPRHWTSLGKSDNWESLGKSNDWEAFSEFERGVPGKTPPRLSSFRLPKGSKVSQLYALIEFAESPTAGYDAIHHSATRLPSKPPTQLSFGEIKSWIKATPGQHHAIGRYQVIPSTFVNLQVRLGLPDKTVFNRSVQDKMAAVLLADAGYHEFMAKEISLERFMDNLALTWAGLPKADGKSHYHGYAGNRATLTRAFYRRQMTAIFSGKSMPDEWTPRKQDRVPIAATQTAVPGDDAKGRIGRRLLSIAQGFLQRL